MISCILFIISVTKNIIQYIASLLPYPLTKIYWAAKFSPAPPIFLGSRGVCSSSSLSLFRWVLGREFGAGVTACSCFSSLSVELSSPLTRRSFFLLRFGLSSLSLEPLCCLAPVFSQRLANIECQITTNGKFYSILTVSPFPLICWRASICSTKLCSISFLLLL